MHILIGIGLFLALLYHWLHGRWFARVVTFMIFLVLVWTITDLLILDRIGPDWSGPHFDRTLGATVRA